MNEDILINMLQDINNENVRFGTVDVSFTFHDGRPVSYVLTFSKRRNLDSHSISPVHHYRIDEDGNRKR